MTETEPKGVGFKYHHCERMAELGIGRFALHYSGHFERFGWALEFEHFTDGVTSVAYEVDNLAFCPWCGQALRKGGADVAVKTSREEDAWRLVKTMDSMTYEENR